MNVARATRTTRGRIGRTVATAVLVVVAGSTSPADVRPRGPQVTLSEPDTRFYNGLDVAVNDVDSALVVWWRRPPFGGAGRAGEIGTMARLVSPDLAAAEPAFLVSDGTGAYPRTAALGGRFVVVWAGPYLRARLVSGAGRPLGAAFDVAESRVTGPSAVASAGDEGFVVVWSDLDRRPPPGMPNDMLGRAFSASGDPASDVFVVGPAPEAARALTEGQAFPEVGLNEHGEMVAVWLYLVCDGYGCGSASLGRGFVGPALEPAAFFSPGGTRSFAGGVAPSGPGRFVVVWSQYDEGGDFEDGPFVGTFATPVASTGEPEAGPVALLPPSEALSFPTVARGGDTLLVVGGGIEDDVVGTVVGPQGPELEGFVVNADTDGEQSLPRVAARGGDGFVVVWRSSQPGASAAGSVEARYVGPPRTLPLFADGFESGGLSAWSTSQPTRATDS